MTSGKPGKQILFFSIPLILSNLLQVCFNMSDIAVVGKFAGPQALGSVGSTTTLYGLFNRHRQRRERACGKIFGQTGRLCGKRCGALIADYLLCSRGASACGRHNQRGAQPHIRNSI